MRIGATGELRTFIQMENSYEGFEGLWERVDTLQHT